MSGMPPNYRSLAAAQHGIPRCSILPPYLLRRLALDDDPHVADVAQRTIGFDTPWRERRIVVAERTQRKPRGLVPPDMVRRAKALDAGKRVQVTATLPAAPERSIHDANHSTFLPGELVRAEGAEPADDVAVSLGYAEADQASQLADVVPWEVVEASGSRSAGGAVLVVRITQADGQGSTATRCWRYRVEGDEPVDGPDAVDCPTSPPAAGFRPRRHLPSDYTTDEHSKGWCVMVKLTVNRPMAVGKMKNRRMRDVSCGD